MFIEVSIYKLLYDYVFFYLYVNMKVNQSIIIKKEM